MCVILEGFCRQQETISHYSYSQCTELMHHLIYSYTYSRDKIFCVLDSFGEAIDGLSFSEGLSVNDGVDYEETLSRAHVLISQRRVLFLASSVQDIQQTSLYVQDTVTSITVPWPSLPRPHTICTFKYRLKQAASASPNISKATSPS